MIRNTNDMGESTTQTDANRTGGQMNDNMKAENAAPNTGVNGSVRVESFEPDQVRPWRFHNRRASGMDDWLLDALAESIERNGQQQHGLARRLPPGDTHRVEAIYGVRRLEACRRAGVRWSAEVREASFGDAECASQMHDENEWSEGVSALETAVQWTAMLDAGVFSTGTELAQSLGCHRGTVARAVRTARALLGEPWIEQLVSPVMHQFSGRSADRLADACADRARRSQAMRRARNLVPGTVPAGELREVLFGKAPGARSRQTVFERRRGKGGGGGTVAARIERDGSGAFAVRVRAHEQDEADLAELAEQLEALIALETASASGVRLGRRLVSLLSAEEAQTVDRTWLEGCVWTAARASGLTWDRWRCAAVANTLRTQRGGWEKAVVEAVRGAQGDTAET